MIFTLEAFDRTTGQPTLKPVTKEWDESAQTLLTRLCRYYGAYILKKDEIGDYWLIGEHESIDIILSIR